MMCKKNYAYLLALIMVWTYSALTAQSSRESIKIKKHQLSIGTSIFAFPNQRFHTPVRYRIPHAGYSYYLNDKSTISVDYRGLTRFYPLKVKSVEYIDFTNLNFQYKYNIINNQKISLAVGVGVTAHLLYGQIKLDTVIVLPNNEVKYVGKGEQASPLSPIISLGLGYKLNNTFSLSLVFENTQILNLKMYLRAITFYINYRI